MQRCATFVLSLSLVVLSRAQAVPLSGTVLDSNSKPIAGATVALSEFTRAARDQDKPLTSTSDQNGAWKIEVEAADAKKPNEVASLVVVHAPGFALAQFVASNQGNKLQLVKGTRASGVVVDAAGKPLANISVRLVSLLDRNIREFTFLDYLRVPKPLEPPFSTRTGADGRWTIANLPSAGEATFEVRDPKYNIVNAKAKLGAEEAPADKATLRLGAIFTGRVVDASGKPVAKAHVSAGMRGGRSGSWASDTTGADGTYRLESLSSGPHIVGARDRDVMNRSKREVEWLAPSQRATAVEGKSVKVPDIVIDKGAIVTGKVFDQAGAPLEGVSVYTAQDDLGDDVYQLGTSDAKGIYKVRVLPGKARIYIGGKPPGYLHSEVGNPSRTIPVTLARGAVKAMNWTLRKGLEVQGVAVGEDRQPIPEVRLSLRSKKRDDWDGGLSSQTDKKGVWKVVGLESGQYALVGDDNWEVVSPKEIALPQRGEVQVQVRRLVSSALEVRAVTPTGEPIPNVTLKFSILVPNGAESWLGHASDGQTDAQGKYVLPKLRPDYRVTMQATRAGYKYLKGGEAGYNGGVWKAPDIVMQPLTGRIQGRIVNSAGEPVAGAKIFSPDARGNPATSDEAGRFVLSELPEGELTLVATHASGAASKAWRAGEAQADLALRPQKRLLAPERDVAFAILEDVWETSGGSKWSNRAKLPSEYVQDDLEGALGMAASAGPDPREGASLGVSSLITRLLKVDAARAIEWAPAQLALITQPELRLRSMVEVGLAAAKSKPELAAQMFAQAKAIPLGKEDNVAEGTALLAALATRIGSGEAEALTDKALRLGKSPGDQLMGVAAALAKGSAAVATRALEAFPPLPPGDNWSRGGAYSAVVKSLAQYDAEGALALLNKIEELQESGDDHAFALSAQELIPALGPRDPKAALAIARRVSGSHGKDQALALAARFQPKEEALKLLREAADSISPHSWIVLSTLGQIAAQAYQLDAKVGAELFDTAKIKMQQMMEEGSWRQQEGAREVAILAFHLARHDPVGSRMILEEEWAFQNALPPAVRQFANTGDLAIAMATLDPARAREMAWQAASPGDGLSQQFEYQMRIARFLLDPKLDANEVMSRR